MTLADDFRQRNFSIYGQWTGVLGIILCLALGIANIFTVHVVRIIFAVLCIASALVILFIEVPWLLRICPTSSTFDNFIRRFTTIWMRVAMYFILSAIQWASLCAGASSLIAAAIVLLIAGLFYALAGLKKQDLMSSEALGGRSVAQMIV